MDNIVKEFEKLLNEQLARVEMMEKDTGALDFATLSPVRIGLIAGDGIGPFIMREARRVADKILADEIKSGAVEIIEINGLTIEYRLEKGEAIPADILEKIKECHVLLKGPTTTPDKSAGGKNIESANVAMRRELDLFANVRPIKIPEKNIDWTFFRENTEGEYVLGSKGVEVPGKLAFDFKVTTDAGTRRIARAAFEFAKNNGKDSVAIVTKANIMKKTDGKFQTICKEVGLEFPQIRSDDWYVDIMAANLLKENVRSTYQVFVLPNLYGDIITDEAAQIQGGVGTAGSANIGSHYAMFEAIHGSAPRMVARGAGDRANPASIIKALEMLLRHIGKTVKADILSEALEKTENLLGKKMTGDKNGITSKEYADNIIEMLK